ncbi:O-succinylbenzoic acid-CoA ligase [Corynebacterium resistens DSM 45100]|uniref:O-succinylbenzoic acid-CoA ligase n=1 Tax=Corynebacterium resistens (strain DSM 45100 / JCM 12819 / GTC 2026 / SICGH 158) TaxID=662755 RepID=F8E2Q6_CORRG|nr:AMP-binding protein [Corynebacterium resistens]AEI10279.1 O-succinylbenzoic acid-CoA ligase [Corynebacterium resistens DSM 45100]
MPDTLPLQAATIAATELPASIDKLRRVMQGELSLLPLPQSLSAGATTPAPNTSTDLPTLMEVGAPIEAGCIIACTSGSTGTPKGAVLHHSNLRASITATEQYLNSHFNSAPGAWLLALPAHHIAGLQVILRSLHAGYAPVAASHLLDGTPFTASSFVTDTQKLRTIYPNAPLYTSLVPAQLQRLNSPEAITALRSYAAILIGGAAADPELIRSLRTHGVNLTLTYGSSETSGGMVYDGHPLPGGTISLADPDSTTGLGRVTLTGPMVARGYRNVDSATAFPSPGTFLTSDLGILLPDATLSIRGRADGAVNIGGYKVLVEDVERAAREHGVSQGMMCALGVDDDRFGQGVVLLIEDATASEVHEATRCIRDQLRGKVARHLIPQKAWIVPELPVTGPGKIDRQQVKSWARTTLLKD